MFTEAGRKIKNKNMGGWKMPSNSFDRLFGINEALLQKVTHQGVVVTEGRSSETVVFVRVPLENKKNLISITAAGCNHHFTWGVKFKPDIEESYEMAPSFLFSLPLKSTPLGISISTTSHCQYLPSPQSPLARPPELWRSALPAGNVHCLQEGEGLSIRDWTPKLKSNNVQFAQSFLRRYLEHRWTSTVLRKWRKKLKRIASRDWTYRLLCHELEGSPPSWSSLLSLSLWSSVPNTKGTFFRSELLRKN